jgi:hypothetical protein
MDTDSFSQHGFDTTEDTNATRLISAPYVDGEYIVDTLMEGLNGAGNSNSFDSSAREDSAPEGDDGSPAIMSINAYDQGGDTPIPEGRRLPDAQAYSIPGDVSLAANVSTAEDDSADAVMAPLAHLIPDLADSNQPAHDLPVARASPRKRRGGHVKERPDMPKAARDGRNHWKAMRAQKQAEWDLRALQLPEDFAARYRQQQARAAGMLGAKEYCLLLELQLCASHGLLTAVGGGDADGFFGWARFTTTGPGFRARLAAMFGGAQEEALQATLSGAGLAPVAADGAVSWRGGWEGTAPFVYTTWVQRAGPVAPGPGPVAPVAPAAPAAHPVEHAAPGPEAWA